MFDFALEIDTPYTARGVMQTLVRGRRIGKKPVDYWIARFCWHNQLAMAINEESRCLLCQV